MNDLAGKIVARVRSNGANIILDGGRLKIVNGTRLPAGARDFIKAHGKAIAAFLDKEGEFEERAAIIEHDGGLDRTSAESLARLLLSSPPSGADPSDWTWFCNHAARIMNDLPMKEAA